MLTGPHVRYFKDKRLITPIILTDTSDEIAALAHAAFQGVYLVGDEAAFDVAGER